MDYMEKYPELRLQFKSLCENRRNEILTHMLEVDDEYTKLRNKRADAGVALRESLDNSKVHLYEDYSDALFAHEIYELDTIYRQAVSDTLNILKETGLI